MFSVLLLFILGVSGANAHCCAPATFETTAINLDSAETDMVYFKIAHDDSRKMESVVKLDSTMTTVLKKYVNDYENSTLYIIEPRATPPKCTVTTLREPFITKAKCEEGHIPNTTNRTVHRNGTLGITPNKIDVENISFLINGRKIWRGMAKGSDGVCFPIYYRIQLLNGRLNQALVNFNATETISYPNIWTIPSYCRRNATSSG